MHGNPSILLTTLLAGALAVASCSDDDQPSGREKESSRALVQQGMEAFQQKQYDRAVQKYTRALEKDPNQAMVHNLLGMAYRFQYNHKRSPALKDKEIAAFRKAIELDPHYVVAVVNLGSSYYHSGRKKEAAEQFQRALELLPNHPDAERMKKMIQEAKQPEEEAQKSE